jgi:hypothetical protein
MISIESGRETADFFSIVIMGILYAISGPDFHGEESSVRKSSGCNFYLT